MVNPDPATCPHWFYLASGPATSPLSQLSCPSESQHNLSLSKHDMAFNRPDLQDYLASVNESCLFSVLGTGFSSIFVPPLVGYPLDFFIFFFHWVSKRGMALVLEFFVLLSKAQW